MQATSDSRPKPLGEAERHFLARQMTNWYYHSGNALLMSAVTFDLWQAVRNNLTCNALELKPYSVRLEAVVIESDFPAKLEKYRENVARSQCSLPRTQMKADLAHIR
jgi:hypothetical protein